MMRGATVILVAFLAGAYADISNDHMADDQKSKSMMAWPAHGKGINVKKAGAQDSNDVQVTKSAEKSEDMHATKTAVANKLMDDKVTKALVDKLMSSLQNKLMGRLTTKDDGADLDKATLAKVPGMTGGGPGTLRMPSTNSAAARFPLPMHGSGMRSPIKYPMANPRSPVHAQSAASLAMPLPCAVLQEGLALQAAAQALATMQSFNAILGTMGNINSLLKEPKEKAVARKYSLVGNWDDWKSFHDFQRKEDSNEDGPVYEAELPVPAGKNPEFQMVGDKDWKNRFFPVGKDGKMIVGPTHHGHGENWKLNEAPDGKHTSKLHVKYMPAAKEGRKLQMQLI